MASEYTPLIQTVRVAPPRARYPHQTCRRFCTIACTCILISGLVSVAVNAFLLWPHHLHHGRHGHYTLSKRGAEAVTHDELRAMLLDTPSADKAREWSQYYTSGPHLAGKNLSQAEWTRDRWQAWGLDSSIVAYDVYINYPVDHALSLLSRSAEPESRSWKLEFNASLVEDVLPEDPTTGLDTRIPTFHGYSASGNVTAPFVYVNYGTYMDFEDLIQSGIRLEGKIALARYGGIFRGLKVKRAQELGMLGTVLYTDPGNDGDVTEEKGFETYPNGPARNPSSVQRGSVQFLSARPGDPSTPGYPSKPGVPRAPVDDAIPSIPSIPISYADALPILRALNGHGPKAADFNEHWTRNLGLGYKGVDYNVGPSPDGLVLNLYNEQSYTTTPLWNVIGIVNGTTPDEVVVVGNHRDAWIAGGAGDPNSGSAILNEVIRGVGKAMEAGWKPLRTIVFASWDGEEYGLIGSTEWVEEYLPWLGAASVAYVNVDVGAAGPNFQAAAAPLLNQLLRDATKLVPSPNQTTKGQSVGDVWDGHIRTMGSGSDFTAFQDFAGIPCIDVSFKGGARDAVYHYHSNYDSLHWMDRYGDPGFQYHEAMAKVIGVLLAELSNAVVIPFGAGEYADALGTYLDQVEGKLNATGAMQAKGAAGSPDAFAVRGAVQAKEATGSPDAFRESLGAMRRSLEVLGARARDLDARAARAKQQLERGLAWWDMMGKVRLWMDVAKANAQYKHLERSFLFEGGLDNRSWFKHVVFAPGLWTGYAGAVYPGLMESIDAKDYDNGVKWARIIDGCVVDAAKSIE